VDPDFVAALARFFGPTAPPRPELLATIAAGAIAPEVVARRPKAHFLEVFFRAQTREFIREWDGSGVDERYVDVDALRRVWSTWPIPFRTATLVQQVWLSADERSRR